MIYRSQFRDILVEAYFSFIRAHMSTGCAICAIFRQSILLKRLDLDLAGTDVIMSILWKNKNCSSNKIDTAQTVVDCKIAAFLTTLFQRICTTTFPLHLNPPTFPGRHFAIDVKKSSTEFSTSSVPKRLKISASMSLRQQIENKLHDAAFYSTFMCRAFNCERDTRDI